jgi:hypothetical protein
MTGTPAKTRGRNPIDFHLGQPWTLLFHLDLPPETHLRSGDNVTRGRDRTCRADGQFVESDSTFLMDTINPASAAYSRT